MQQYVVSSTLQDPEWTNTTIIDGDPIIEIKRLKDQPGQDIVQYGFGELSHALVSFQVNALPGGDGHRFPLP